MPNHKLDVFITLIHYQNVNVNNVFSFNALSLFVSDTLLKVKVTGYR